MGETSPCSLVVVRSHWRVFSRPCCEAFINHHCRGLLSHVEVLSGIILYHVIHRMRLIGMGEAPLIEDWLVVVLRHWGTDWHIWIGYLLLTELWVLALPSVTRWIPVRVVHQEVVVYWERWFGRALVDQTLYLAGISILTVSVARLKLLGRLKLDRVVPLSLVGVVVQLAQLLHPWVHCHQFIKRGQSRIPKVCAAWNGQCPSLNGDLLLCLFELVVELGKLRKHLVERNSLPANKISEVLQLARPHFHEGGTPKVIVQLLHLLEHQQVGLNQLVLDEIVSILEYRVDCGIGLKKLLLHRQGFLPSLFPGFPTAIAALWLVKSRWCRLVASGARATTPLITLFGLVWGCILTTI